MIMSAPGIAHLADRGVLRVSGADAVVFLGNLITNDVVLLDREPAIYAGLLTPQGKILADFIVVRDPAGQGFLLDVARAQQAALAAKLKIYRLRSKVDIEEIDDAGVYAIWGSEAGVGVSGFVYRDPRLLALGWRIIQRGGLQSTLGFDAYHAHRIALGVPEGGKDWDFADTFPHEALFDQLHGVSFEKGCYVGQEIVSRMEHRGTARKRVVPVVGAAPLPHNRDDVLAGEAVIGTLGSVSGERGLALLRLDRVGEAMAKGQSLAASGVPLRVELPLFARFTIGASNG